jgi:uncharacterized protein (UPF0335 family)
MNDVIDNSSRDYLKQFIARVERLEEEKQSVLEEIRDSYAEAKAQGFDAKALRQIVKIRKADKNQLAEQEELIDLYKHALGMI